MSPFLLYMINTNKHRKIVHVASFNISLNKCTPYHFVLPYV